MTLAGTIKNGVVVLIIRRHWLTEHAYKYSSRLKMKAHQHFGIC